MQVGRGDSLGAVWALTGGVHDTSALAIRDSELVRMSKARRPVSGYLAGSNGAVRQQWCSQAAEPRLGLGSSCRASQLCIDCWAVQLLGVVAAGVVTQ